MIGRFHLTALVALCLLGLGLRWCFLFQGVRYDEAFTLLDYSAKPLFHTLSVYDWPNNHVLHSVLVHFTCAWFGQELWALRLPALVCGLLLIPASYAVACVYFNRTAGLLAAGLVASSSYLIFYSTNGRGYTLLALCSMVLFAMAPFLLRHRNWVAWGLFSVVAALGFFTIPIMLYPYTMVLVWLGLSCVCGDATAGTRREFARVLAISVAVTAGLTLVLYAPILAVSGPASLFANQFVRPVGWNELLAGWHRTVKETWYAWNQDVPGVLSFLLLLGLLISQGCHRRLSTYRVPLAPVCVVCCAGLLLVQRVVPFARVWLFLLPLYFVLASAGGSLLLQTVEKRFRFCRDYAPAVLAMTISLWLGANVLHSQSPRKYLETGTLPDAEEITLRLQPLLSPDDKVLAIPPSTYPLRYYFRKYNLPAAAFVQHTNPTGRVFVVVNEWCEPMGQMLEQVLTSSGLADRVRPDSAIVVCRFETATLYEVRLAH